MPIRPYIIAAPQLLLIWLIYLLHKHPVIENVTLYANALLKSGDPREVFITSTVDVYVPRFDASPLRAECLRGEWHNDLILDCSSTAGGLTAVRQKILTCVRWGIAWKMPIILPTIRPRIGTNASEMILNKYIPDSQAVGLEYYFDRDLFVSRLRDGCPQMVQYESIKEIGSPERVQRVGIAWPLENARNKASIEVSMKERVENHRGGRGNISVYYFGSGKRRYD
jgi:hypothetical protein